MTISLFSEVFSLLSNRASCVQPSWGSLGTPETLEDGAFLADFTPLASASGLAASEWGTFDEELEGATRALLVLSQNMPLQSQDLLVASWKLWFKLIRERARAGRWQRGCVVGSTCYSTVASGQGVA